MKLITKILLSTLLLSNFLSASQHKNWNYNDYYNFYDKNGVKAYSTDLLILKLSHDKMKLNKEMEEKLLGMIKYVYDPYPTFPIKNQKAKVIHIKIDDKNKIVNTDIIVNIKKEDKNKIGYKKLSIAFFSGMSKGFCFNNILTKPLINNKYNFRYNFYANSNKNVLIYKNTINKKLCNNIKKYNGNLKEIF